jgi:hypothetical protein
MMDDDVVSSKSLEKIFYQTHKEEEGKKRLNKSPSKKYFSKSDVP